MGSWKCSSSAGAASLHKAALCFSDKMVDRAHNVKDERVNGHAVDKEVDIDLREVYFLIIHFLLAGPCQRTSAQLWNELLEHQLLPRRYHAWYSRTGALSGDDDDDGISFPLHYNRLVERYSHVSKDHLVKLMKQLILNTAHQLNGEAGGNTPNAADVPTLLGSGHFSLIDSDRKKQDKQAKDLPLYQRWPHMQADQVHGLNLREIGGGYTKHHRAPSIRSACYAIAKPSTMVQKMENRKKLRGHRDAVYCAIFDRSGRYAITGSDDRLVKIWSMETAFCLASCRGHEGDITDLAISSNNLLVASASNDFVIRVWRIPDGVPVSVLRGHTGAVTTIAFSPRPSAVYQLLSSSDDGTCRLWDARFTQCNPRVYVPRPSDAVTGKSNGPSSYVPSSSNGAPSHQILCCAYNANGTVFVTGSSDTFARVWSALKSNSDESEQPVHEMDLLSGHENDVNYVQFSGCSVASKISTSDSLKEENIPRFRNSWFCHDNIVTCSRDGSAIIWVPRSRKSHGKVGRWTRAYHLKVPSPPLPPQPPRGGPRQRFLPTPRGVNMIIWSLDNRFVLAAIMDCRICVWNAVDGSLVYSLTGHTASSYVLDVHPFNPRIAMSAGYDGRTIVWDIWEGKPIRKYEMGPFKLVDGKFSPDGTSIVLSDDVGQLYLLNTGEGESQKDTPYDQFFLGDYRPLIQDTLGNVLDQETQLPPHRRNVQDPICDSSMIPYPEPYQSQYQKRRLGALGIEWRPPATSYAVGPDFSLGQDYPMFPLEDLERLIEPQPELMDALYWEPENEVVSDDTDSEYNAAKETSSEAEQESISSSSSSDLECSGEDNQIDQSKKDGLRRSRRKKHKSCNAEVELTALSGRRVKKRSLDDCVEPPSGSSRTNKVKRRRKPSNQKSYKAKMLRPQRAAAQNARNMLSQISSSDGVDSEDESSNSLQDSFILSQPEMNLQNVQQEVEEKCSNECAEVAMPAPFSESHGNVGNKRRLILKFSLRDSKKYVTIEEPKVASESQADLVLPCSRIQDSNQGNIIDGCSTDPAPSTGNKEHIVKQGEMEICTSTCPSSEDAMLSDTYAGIGASFNGLIDQNSSSKGKQLATDELSLGSVRNSELPHDEKAHTSSSFNSLSHGASRPTYDSSLKDSSQKFSEDSLERKENFPPNSSNDQKMIAPLNPTKLIIRKNQISTDTKSSFKIKIRRGDVNLDNPFFLESKQYVEKTEVADDIGKSSSLRQRKRSWKGEVSTDDFCDVEGNTSTVCNEDEVGVDVPEALSDSLRRSQFISTNVMAEASNANPRLRFRGDQSSVGTSKRAESSSRATRNQRGGACFTLDPISSTQKRSAKKLSWLMLEHDDPYRYIPQLGDEVVYLRQGHQEFIDSGQSSELGPWGALKGINAVEVCKVEELSYAPAPGSGDSCCKIKLSFVDHSSSVHGRSFKLTLPELINFPDFIVEKTRYDAAMSRNWTCGEECMVWWRNENGEDGRLWDGQILSLQAKCSEFPDSPWERYEVLYKDDPSETHYHSPWELHDFEFVPKQPHLDHKIRDKLVSYFNKLYMSDRSGLQVLSRAAEKSDFLNRFPVPLDPQLLCTRLNNDYYRTLEGVRHDIRVMLSNAENFFMGSAGLPGKIRRLSDLFEKKLASL